MTRFFTAFPLILLGIAVTCGSVAADSKPKKEGCFGRLSTTPSCNEEQPGRRTSLAPFRKPHQPYSIGKNPAPKAPGSGEIVSQSFRRVTDSLGEWSGVVSGNGVVHLALQITENGALKSVRYIGNVTLTKDSTSFHFRSPIPHTAKWDWKVIAFGRQA